MKLNAISGKTQLFFVGLITATGLHSAQTFDSSLKSAYETAAQKFIQDKTRNKSVTISIEDYGINNACYKNLTNSIVLDPSLCANHKLLESTLLHETGHAECGGRINHFFKTMAHQATVQNRIDYLKKYKTLNPPFQVSPTTPLTTTEALELGITNFADTQNSNSLIKNLLPRLAIVGLGVQNQLYEDELYADNFAAKNASSAAILQETAKEYANYTQQNQQYTNYVLDKTLAKNIPLLDKIRYITNWLRYTCLDVHPTNKTRAEFFSNAAQKRLNLEKTQPSKQRRKSLNSYIQEEINKNSIPSPKAEACNKPQPGDSMYNNLSWWI